jgi:hypothetical protein
LRDKVTADRPLIFKALSFVAYTSSQGPWRNTWIKYGVDPRLDKSMRIYQIIDIRDKKTSRKSTRAGTRLVKQTAPNIPHADFPEYIFDGINFSTQSYFQIIDVVLPHFEKKGKSIVYCRSTCDVVNNGWYIDGHLSILRQELKKLKTEHDKQAGIETVDENSVSSIMGSVEDKTFDDDSDQDDEDVTTEILDDRIDNLIGVNPSTSDLAGFIQNMYSQTDIPYEFS